MSSPLLQVVSVTKSFARRKCSGSRWQLLPTPGLFEVIFAQGSHRCCLGCCHFSAVSGNEEDHPAGESLDHPNLFQDFCFMVPSQGTSWSMEAVSAGDNKLGACTATKMVCVWLEVENYMGGWRKVSLGKQPTWGLQEAFQGRAGYYGLSNQQKGDLFWGSVLQQVKERGASADFSLRNAGGAAALQMRAT